MNLEKTIEKINKGREKDEAAFVFCLWKEPELYADYLNLNAGQTKTLYDEDAIFYYGIGRGMYNAGYQTFDAISCETFLSDKPSSKKKFDEYGGFSEVMKLKSLVDTNNMDTYFDRICRRNALLTIANKTEEMFSNVERFDEATAEDVYNAFDLVNSTAAIDSSQREVIEELDVDEEYIESCIRGDEMGLSYAKAAPLLNYLTLGAAPGLYMIAGQSGSGKSSFAFETFIMGLFQNGNKTAIVSNEMGIRTYKNLLLIHILTNDLNYYGLTRKKIKMGKYTEEERAMLDKAVAISKEKYKGKIFFLKMYNNNIGKILKQIKRLKNKCGVEAVFYDTFKSDDESTTDSMWQTLLLDSRRLFQTCDKLGIPCFTSYQLAPHTINQRYLDVGCLSNAKQIKETYETMVFFRRLWDDEYPEKKYDVHPYRINKENNKVHDVIELDPNKMYYVLFLDKTRSDQDKQCLLYEWQAHYNKWKELGFCKVSNLHQNF